ncbi:zincin-like metallopeptidase domain-containing protein [Bradyrhizobium barranii subsp. apii]|uniref:zincin-like metallopeptidase domain-containing protein n=1 Tax=Bradyrhizobium barranii TaxID=2992140 RepID=UPI001AA14261|nr:zincin-like metallopeptidase domain-containing protein [Bradyrhizobium barranii]UPT96287.1 zincin-like metallopeptidase domain-containing protein [Bradyrhizobium barranii subsp. apii]
MERIAKADEFFAATSAQIRHGGNVACYSVTSDEVRMPPFETFRDAESYYGTLAHEMTHYAVSRIMPHGRV